MEVPGRIVVKRKRPNKVLIALLLFLLLAILILAICVGVLANKSNNDANLCDSPECAMVAGEMLARMNLSADPCTDFYQYACGQYASPANRAPDISHLTTFALPGAITDQQVAAALSSPGNEYNGRQSTAVAKVKKFYSVCMNDMGDDAKGRAVLLKVIKNLQSWPLSTDPASGTWNASTWTLQNVIGKAVIQNFPALLTIGLINHPSDSDKNVLGMVATGLTLQHAPYYDIPTAQKAYRDLFEAILILLYGPLNATIYREWSQKLWSFEKSLAEIFPTPDEMQQIHRISNIMPISEVQKKVTFLNVTQLMNNGFQGAGANITPNDELLIGTIRYFERLSSLIKNLGSESKEILATYIVWTALYHTSSYAGESFAYAHQIFAQTLLGVTPSGSRKWKTCALETVNALGFAAGAVHAQKHFEADDRSRISKFIQITIDEFILSLPNIDWLKEETRKKSEEKARAVNWQIGYPEIFDDPQELDEYYQDFTVFDNRCQNLLEFKRFQYKSGVMKYGKAVNKKEWLKMPTETNAYYYSPSNQIVVLGGILQKPMYSRHFPLSIFYGAMGSVLAHELIHGFDTTGRNYDLNGKVVDWWDPESAKAYQERAACFQEQYSSLKFQGHPVNGNLSVGENVADCGGIKLAYHAFIRATTEGGANLEERVLPGLKMNGPQQFFLAFANIWCINVNDAIATRLVVEDNHSQGPIRVNTALKNTPQFAEAFNCPSSSPMNPSKRCSIW